MAQVYFVPPFPSKGCSPPCPRSAHNSQYHRRVLLGLLRAISGARYRGGQATMEQEQTKAKACQLSAERGQWAWVLLLETREPRKPTCQRIRRRKQVRVRND